MKITGQLRLDRIASDGTTPVHLTITWESNRVGTGAAARLELSSLFTPTWK